MTDIRLDTTTDDVVVGTDLELVIEIEDVAQQHRVRLDFQKGEWFLDLTAGIPYLEDMLVRNPDLGAIGAELRSQILTIPFVIRLDQFDLAFDNTTGQLTLDFISVTPFGLLRGAAADDDIVSLIQLLLLTPLSSVA